MGEPKNPFDIVKATDLTDAQIAGYFVDFREEGGLLERAKPKSRMPMIIFGGKGSGKTHLMRFLSYPLQLRRLGGRKGTRLSIASEGYLGIYFRCGGLNAQRFAGKGQGSEVWQEVFAYYMELWFAQLVLDTVSDLYEDVPEILTPDLVSDACRLLDIPPSPALATISDLTLHLKKLQREADVAINNCALTRYLDIRVHATAGRLVFGLPQVIARHIVDLGSALFVYLIDEFENLTESQQRYINTLVRERQDPCTLKIGVRLYGLRTRQTLSAGEDNREDSEYEPLRLDAELRDRPMRAQLNFATDLVRKRLKESGYMQSVREQDIDLPSQFESGGPGRLLQSEATILKERYREKEPPYIVELRRKLQQGMRADATPGLRSNTDVERMLELLRFPDDPFVERANVFLFYRAWAQRETLPQAAADIAESAQQYVARAPGSLHREMLKHFRSDVVAQLLRDTKQKQKYLGFHTFVIMSAGLPRGLLTILKYVFTWSVFYSEEPFREGRISIRAQTEGASQASDWFFAEARAPGRIGTQVRDSMTRLGQLLRDLRFSDKPSECSLSTFSANLTTASQEARCVLDEAENWSMLLRTRGGQHDRNEGRVDEKYQVHPMLAPRWDLPIASRGSLALSGEEITSIFAPSSAADFEAVLRSRVDRMTAPFFASRRQMGSSQESLPGMSGE